LHTAQNPVLFERQLVNKYFSAFAMYFQGTPVEPLKHVYNLQVVTVADILNMERQRILLSACVIS